MTKQKTVKINELLIAQVAHFLDPYLKKLHDHSIENRGNKIEVFGRTDGTPTSIFTLIQLEIVEEYKQVFIPKIYLPPFLRHQGIGKRLIKVVYEAAVQLDYELFIVLLTDSFYARLRKRGALQCEKPDMVQIVDSTVLD
jgi:GNAT superfamily N-acetyltransferase